jgi:hypothetical protein
MGFAALEEVDVGGEPRLRCSGKLGLFRARQVVLDAAEEREGEREVRVEEAGESLGLCGCGWMSFWLFEQAFRCSSLYSAWGVSNRLAGVQVQVHLVKSYQ